MTINLILSRALARSADINQVINWFRGSPTDVDAVSLTGYSSASIYNTTISNRDNSIPATGGKALSVNNYNNAINLLRVSHAGSEFRPSAPGLPSITAYDSGGVNVFSVSDAGITSGGGNITTDSNAQTLTNKVLSGDRVSNYLDISQPSASAPTAPSATILRLYAVTGDTFLRYIVNGSTISTLATVEGTQTLLSKSLTSPNLATPFVSDYLTLGTNAGATPAAGKLIVYESSDVLRYRKSDTTDLAIASITGVETLTQKTLDNPITVGAITFGQQASAAATPGANKLNVYSINGSTQLSYKDSSGSIHNILDSLTALSGVTLTSPSITNYAEFSFITNPGSPAASKGWIWANADNNLHYNINGGGSTTILTTSNTPSVSTFSMARAMALGGL